MNRVSQFLTLMGIVSWMNGYDPSWLFLLAVLSITSAIVGDIGRKQIQKRNAHNV